MAVICCAYACWRNANFISMITISAITSFLCSLKLSNFQIKHNSRCNFTELKQDLLGQIIYWQKSHFQRGKNRNISFPWCALDLIVESVPANIISAGPSIIRALIFLQAFLLNCPRDPIRGAHKTMIMVLNTFSASTTTELMCGKWEVTWCYRRKATAWLLGLHLNSSLLAK